MKSEVEQNKKFVISRKLIFTSIAIILIIGLISGTTYYVISNSQSNQSMDQELQTAKATLGSISTTVTGSGPVTSSKRINMPARVSGDIIDLGFKEGDTVKKGDMIYKIDDSTAINDLLKTQSQLIQQQSNVRTDEQTIKNLNVVAPISGTITKLSVGIGDIIQKNMNVATITDTSKLEMVVPFNASSISKISVGDSANVSVQSLMGSVKGTVTYIGNKGYAADGGGVVYDVEIMINNPGSLQEGMDASADIQTSSGDETSVSSSKLSYAKKINVVALSSGTVSSIAVKQNQYVSSGNIIIKLKNDDAQTTLKNDEDQVKVTQAQYDYSNKQHKDYIGYSPIDGTIVSQTVNIGDSAKQGDVMAIVADDTKMEFPISVDELDIAKIKVGQSVSITADALTETQTMPLSGVVSKISPEGTSSNGVTTYTVTVAVTGGSSFSGRRRFRNGSSGFGGNFGNGSGRSQSGSGSSRNFSGSSNGNWGSFGNSGSNKNSGSGRNSGNFNAQSFMKNMQAQSKNALANLKPGMNANATILVTNKQNVLTVPLQAIHKYQGKNYVVVKSTAKEVAKLKKEGKYIDIFNRMGRNGGFAKNGSGSQSSNRSNRSNGSGNNGSSFGNSSRGSGSNSSGFGSSSGQSQNSNFAAILKQQEQYYSVGIPVEVQVGLNDESNIEITSGLKEGQTLILPPITTTQSSTGSQQGSGYGSGMGLGGMGGGFGGGYGGGYGSRNSGSSRYGSSGGNSGSSSGSNSAGSGNNSGSSGGSNSSMGASSGSGRN